MKKVYLILTCFLSLFGFNSFSQSATDYAGDWQGVLNVGIELQIVFHLQSGDGQHLSGTADSPDQSAYGFALDSVYIQDGMLEIRINDLHAAYSGKLINDSTLDGIFTQRAELPLTLHRGIKTVKKNNRPQTPVPPFPYKSEDIIYENAGKTLHYGATITIPEGTGPFPSIVMITGSGAENRDEEIFGHKPFAVIADYLTQRGFIVLRIDDRGVGKTSKDDPNSTSADYATDISAGVDYLLGRPEVNQKKIGLIGHSEGGMIAPMVANMRKDISFIVLLAGPGVKITELMAAQSAAILKSSGISEKSVDAYIPFYKDIIHSILYPGKNETAEASCTNVMNEWMKKADTAVISELGMNIEADRKKMITEMVKQMSLPWFKYFISYDPQPALQKLNCKVLALNGDRDIQVIASQNIPGIEASLKKSKSKIYETHILKGLNHLFQTCNECSVQEYAKLEETFSPDALKIMGDWLEKNEK